MTSSPTPAVLPDARAREVLAETRAKHSASALMFTSEDTIVAAMLAFAQKATPSASDAAVPAGFVLVPVEPTEAMCKAVGGMVYGPTVWRTMLAAAPKVASDTGADYNGHVPNEYVPPLPKGAKLFAVNCETEAWHYINHAGTWQGMPSPLRASDTGAGLAEREDAGAMPWAHGWYDDGGNKCVVPYLPTTKTLRGVSSEAFPLYRRAATPTDATDGATGGGDVGS